MEINPSEVTKILKEQMFDKEKIEKILYDPKRMISKEKMLKIKKFKEAVWNSRM